MRDRDKLFLIPTLYPSFWIGVKCTLQREYSTLNIIHELINNFLNYEFKKRSHVYPGLVLIELMTVGYVIRG